MKKYLVLSAFISAFVVLLTGSLSAQRVKGTRDVEAGAYFPVGFVPALPLTGYISLPYIDPVTDEVKVRSREGVYVLQVTKTAAPSSTVTASVGGGTRYNAPAIFESVFRWKKAVPAAPPVGYYAQYVDPADGKLKLRSRTTLYTVGSGGTTPAPTNCTANPISLVGGVTPYNVGGWKVDLNWSGGTPGFTVQVKNANGAVTNTIQTSDRNAFGTALNLGSNTIEVTDVNGCKATATATAGTAPANPCSASPVDIQSGATTVSNYSTPAQGAQTDINWSGGTSPFMVVVKNAANVVTQTRQTTERNAYGNLLSAGQTNTIVVTDANGCTDSVTSTVP